MNVNEMRQKSVEDLKKEHTELVRERFNMRMQRASGQTSKGHEFRRVRRDIARVLTILREKVGTEA